MKATTKDKLITYWSLFRAGFSLYGVWRGAVAWSLTLLLTAYVVGPLLRLYGVTGIEFEHLLWGIGGYILGMQIKDKVTIRRVTDIKMRGDKETVHISREQAEAALEENVTVLDPTQPAPDRWAKYARKSVAELRPWTPDMDLTGVSISDVDAINGSPKDGDMIARNPANHKDQWLVSKEYFGLNFAGEIK